MSFADDLINRLFGQTNAPNKSNPGTYVADSGTIIRSEDQRLEFLNWKKLHGEDLLFELRQNALFSQKNLGERLDFVWLNQRSAKGFRFNAGLVRTPIYVEWFVIELLKDQVKALGYVEQNSQYQSIVANEQPKFTEMYYLKPPLSVRMAATPAAQVYGNIMVSKELTNTHLVSLLATTYEGRNYTPPLAFDDLVERLFGGLSS